MKYAAALAIGMYFAIAAIYPDERRTKCWFAYWVLGGEGCGNPFKTPSWYLMIFGSIFVIDAIISSH